MDNEEVKEKREVKENNEEEKRGGMRGKQTFEMEHVTVIAFKLTEA